MVHYWASWFSPGCNTDSAWQNQQNYCAPSSIRPVWSVSLLCAQWVAKDQRFLHADTEDSDQTGRMHRLTWVFTGRTCHFVGFVMRRLKYYGGTDNKHTSRAWSDTMFPRTTELGPYTVIGHCELMDHHTKDTEAVFELLRSEFQL